MLKLDSRLKKKLYVAIKDEPSYIRNRDNVTEQVSSNPNKISDFFRILKHVIKSTNKPAKMKFISLFFIKDFILRTFD